MWLAETQCLACAHPLSLGLMPTGRAEVRACPRSRHPPPDTFPSRDPGHMTSLLRTSELTSQGHVSSMGCILAQSGARL